MNFWWDNIDSKYLTDDLDVIKLAYVNCLKNRTIFINDRIDDDSIEKYLVPLMFMNEDNSDKPITILLNSYGGEIVPSFSIVYQIERMRKETNIVIIGQALSSGLYIAMAGHNNENVNTYCTPYARAMFHTTYVVSGNSDDDSEPVKSLVSFQNKYDKDVVYRYITSHSYITLEMLEEWEGTDHYMSAQELEKFGIARII